MSLEYYAQPIFAVLFALSRVFKLTTPEGLLLRPGITLPIEIYSAGREAEFDAAEAELATLLAGKAVDAALVAQCAAVAVDESSPIDDVRATAWYRQKAGTALVAQALASEDPTCIVSVNPDTDQTLISGMGELHLEIYVERMKREYGTDVDTGKPRVAYRETITQRAEFNYTHKKQTGGSGQYGRVAGYMEPITEGDEDFIFDNQVRGGSIPTQYIAACEKGFLQCLAKGPKMEFPVTGVKIVINDGASHAVDSSDMAFQAAARGAFREGYGKAKPVIHEPIMKVVVETPTEFQGGVMGLLNQRRGMIVGAQDEGPMTVVEAQVPLGEMFGFSTVLRSSTQGKAQFTMEFALYRQIPQSIAEKIAEEVALRKKSAA